MAKRVTRRDRLIKKLMSPYRMVIVNEETFEEQLQFRLSRLNVIILLTLLLAILTTTIFLTIAYTPIKEYIPGYDSSELRKKAIKNIFTADSLISIYDKNARYLESVQKVLSGTVEFEETNENNDISESLPPNFEYENPAATEDALLRNLVAQEDKYNVFENNIQERNLLVFPPAEGPISQDFNAEEAHYAVDIVLAKDTPIKAIADGTVVFAEWSVQTGHVIILQHDLGVLSVYKHNASLAKKQGETVAAGEVIATAGNTGEYSTGWHLHFEIWMDDYPMDPKDFFNF